MTKKREKAPKPISFREWLYVGQYIIKSQPQSKVFDEFTSLSLEDLMVSLEVTGDLSDWIIKCMKKRISGGETQSFSIDHTR